MKLPLGGVFHRQGIAAGKLLWTRKAKVKDLV